MITIQTVKRGGVNNNSVRMEVLFKNAELHTERLLRVDVDTERNEINASATGDLTVQQTKEFIHALEIGCAIIGNEIKVV